MRRHLLDYVRCAVCGRKANRDTDLGGWVELTFPKSILGLFDVTFFRRNVCPEDAPKLGWPYNVRNRNHG